MTNLWYQVTASVPAEAVDAAAALMRDASPGGVSIEEPVEILGPEEGFRVLDGKPVLIHAYVPASELGAVLTDDLRHTMQERFPGTELTAKPVQQEDWSVSWREFFGVVHTGGRIVVVPSWIEYEAAPGELIIRLDPGQAFGTGHHETTRLCLRALEDAVTPGCSVYDVGIGSGILAIGAVLLGAGRVAGTDIDPIASDVALENIEENGLTGRIDVSAGAIGPDHGATYDVVVANINRDANIKLAETFAAITRAGSSLLLSGILSDDADRVTGAMEAAGFVATERRHERDWCLLGFQRS
ncbi:MAG: 50S ribosomal protein L11 methyltransferase [Dehalococcoidia bacterium]|nr:50S ribosomal protein L11 methyltransferase [Dehalococcoidia bacterium]